MRLIDADDMRQRWLEDGENEYVYDTNAVLDSIDEQPTVDAVEVVRCRDCKHFDGKWFCQICGVPSRKPDDFCSYGERRTDDRMSRLTYYCPDGKGGGEWRANVRGTEVKGEEIDRLAAFENLREKGDLVPVVHGWWNRITRGNYECSHCGCIPYYAGSINTLRYCPNCGARMDGGRNATD